MIWPHTTTPATGGPPWVRRFALAILMCLPAWSVAIADDATTAASQPMTAASQPMTAASQPMTATSQPMTATSQPAPLIAQPGLDYSSWNGAMLTGPRGSLWGVRVGYIDQGRLVTGTSFTKAVTVIGPYADDASYAQITAGPLEITWAAGPEGSIVGSARALRDGLVIVLEAYPAHDFWLVDEPVSQGDPPYVPFLNPAHFLVAAPGVITGLSTGIEVAAGTSQVTGGRSVTRGRWERLCPADEGQDAFWLVSAQAPARTELSRDCEGFDELQGRSGVMVFDPLAKGQTICFQAASGADPLTPPPAVDAATITATIAAAPARNQRDLAGEGPLGEAAGPMFDAMLWIRTWHPFQRRVFLPPGRTWMGNGRYNHWGWDENFNALVAAVVDVDLARTNLLLAAGDDRIGAFAVWRVYRRSGDRSLLEQAYPLYRKLFSPGNARLVTAGGPDKYNVGKGMDDTPMREPGRNLGDMYSLDMSCLKAVRLEVLAKMARVLDKPADARRYEQSYRDLIAAINQTFWHEPDGIYRNRYISGEWALCESPTSFYPLLAGVPSPEQAQRLVRHLLDERKFWGRYVIPSLSKADPEYGLPSQHPHDGRVFPPFCYWRGAIWPPPNYLVYEGLKRYRLDVPAAELATKSAAMWLENWRDGNKTCENYDPQTGGRTECASKAQSWAMLLPLMGIQELIDVEPWDDSDGLRFGTLAKQPSRLSNLRLQGHAYDVVSGGGLTQLTRDGQLVFEARGGNVVVRRFVLGPDGQCSFQITADADVQLLVSPPGRAQPVQQALPAGEHRLNIDPQAPTTQPR